MMSKSIFPFVSVLWGKKMHKYCWFYTYYTLIVASFHKENITVLYKYSLTKLSQLHHLGSINGKKLRLEISAVVSKGKELTCIFKF